MANDVKTVVDWESIEAHYRAGLRSLRDIAAQYQITEGAIRKRAKRDGWVRDLSAKVQAKAEELVRTEVVRKAVRSESAVSERVLIEVNAQVIADRVLGHRAFLRRAITLAEHLLQELESTTRQIDAVEALADLVGDDPKRREAFERAISLPGRAGILAKLGEAGKAFITLDRQAFSMEGGGSDEAENLKAAADGAAKGATAGLPDLQARFDAVLGRVRSGAGPVGMAYNFADAVQGANTGSDPLLTKPSGSFCS